MWEDNQYCWVVFCKNRWFHLRRNLFYRHKIILGQTDAIAAVPSLGNFFIVQCQSCGKSYSYKPSEVLRYELAETASFDPHPLFHDENR